jgi:O-antigen ligase
MGMVMLEVMLYHRRRHAFWYAAPLLALVFGGYLLAFWNTEKGAGFPAQAVKTVVAPGELSEDDKGSDLYRTIENYNVVYTIRTQPLTGIGFGQQYLRPIPNADISFAQWWEYRSHNAILWIWMKTGLGGFLAMLYLFTAAIRHGTRRLMRVLPGYDGALLLTSVLFVVMFAVFAYVDIVWDTESMIFLGIAFAGIASDILGEPRGETAPSGPKSRWGRSFGRPGARLRF